MRELLAVLLVAASLTGCGGEQSSPVPAQNQTMLLAQSGTGEVRVFPGPRANYSIGPAAGNFTVSDLVSGGAPVTVPPGTRLRFADISLALDVDGNAGQAYRLYKAAFNRMPDLPGLSFWLDAMARGVSLETVAENFVQSNEFKAIYGSNPTSQDIVNGFYQNVLGRAGDDAGIVFWKGALDRGDATVAQVLVGFSESRENRDGVFNAISFGVPFLENGVDYVPTANAGSTQIVDLARTVRLDGSLSTVSVGKPIIYTWSMTSRPAGSTAGLTDANAAKPFFTPDVEGIYDLSLTVGDGMRTSAVSKTSVVALWRPANGVVPSSGNFVYLESENGDPVGGGKTFLYTPRDSIIKFNGIGRAITVEVSGGTNNWNGGFLAPNSQLELERGYNGGLGRLFTDGSVGSGLEWRGLQSCNRLTGWFMVDSVTFKGGVVSDIDLRFEQRCEGAAGALRGRIRWSASDTTTMPVPDIPPPPANLWKPPAGSTPQSGNYVYLESESGDYLGQGRTYLNTSSTATMSVGASGVYLTVGVRAEQMWNGGFSAMYPLTALQSGYYSNLTLPPLFDPYKAGLTWNMEGRRCDLASGWFVIDRVTYAAGMVSELDLRFEHRCQGSTGALHGKVHWSATDTTTPPGPVNPPPGGLWQPAPGTTPTLGSYVYLESMPGDPVGRGQTSLYTKSTAYLFVSGSGNRANVLINAQDAAWAGALSGMDYLRELQVGYYGDLRRFSNQDPRKGGLSWMNGSLGCDTLSGWFVVDKVTYVQTNLAELDFRFMQKCTGAAGPLYGKVHWSASD